MISVTADDADRVLTVKVGEEIAITMAENPTSGFQWTIESLPSELTRVSSEFDRHGEARPGAGGHRIIRLLANVPGRAELRLRYGRGWEGAAAARQCTFTFAIRSA